MRTISEGTRGCGTRKAGATYLVSEPGEGELPLWSAIEPPIPYEDGHFRGWVEIDLEATLEQRTVVLAGTSAERKRTEDSHSWEIEQFGMTLRTRLRVGIGKGRTEEGVAGRLSELSMHRNASAIEIIGGSLRGLGTMEINRLDAELAKVWCAAQENDAPAILAACWRMSHLLPPGKVRDAKRYLMRMMVLIGAPEDALTLRDRGD